MLRKEVDHLWVGWRCCLSPPNTLVSPGFAPWAFLCYTGRVPYGGHGYDSGRFRSDRFGLGRRVEPQQPLPRLSPGTRSRALALDIGCGTGAFARLLAERADRVLGLDLSPHMIRLARERSRQYSNVDFRVADVTAWAFPRARFDCIASIATFHHLPLEEMLVKTRGALKVGGTLLILDLYEQKGLAGFFVGALAVPVHLALRLIKTGRLRQSREAREAWAQHGLHEAYLSLSRIQQSCARLLPGAWVRRHLLWRYSIVWKKEA